MIIEFSTYLCNLLYKEKLIDDKERELYEYGFQITIANLLNIFMIILIGIVCRSLAEASVFLIVFASLRYFCGGYHADTYKRCISLFSIICFLVMVLTKISAACQAHISILIVSVLAQGWCIYKKAPIEHEHRPLSEEEAIRFRRWSFMVFGFWSAAAAAAHLLKACHFESAVSVTMVTVAFLMLSGSNKKQSTISTP